MGANNRGRALVYYGSASGPSATPSWIYVGTTTDIGRSVGTAGDVNGDGYDDVIVTTAYGGLDSTSTKGAAYVFHGSASGLSDTPNWQVSGPQSFDQFGNSASTAGDVNNDGYSDVIVGAPVILSSTGQAFLYLGSSSGLSTTPIWTGTGEGTNHRYGDVVRDAGDVNGDSYDDIVVGAPDDNPNGPGKVYVYYGNSSGVSASADWTATGTSNSNFGSHAGTSGDYNGDGFSDVVIGAPGYSPYGKAFVYKGSSTGLSVNSVWTFEGDASVAALGVSVGTAGDVNNDGYDDVLITPYTPKAFVFHGIEETAPSISYTPLSNTGTSATRNFSNVTITDSSGVNGTSGTRPRCYFKRRSDANTFNDNTNSSAGWKYVEANGSSSPFDFTINYALLSGGNGISGNDTVQYFVVAQDLALIPNVGINSGTFAAAPSSVNLTSAAFPISGAINSYLILPVQVTGALVGNGSYQNLSFAFSTIKSGSQTGADIVILIQGNTNEFVAQLFENSWNTLVIKPDGGGARTVTGSNSGAAVIDLDGADRVTIDGLNSGGNSLTISNTSGSGTSGTSTLAFQLDASNNFITRCTILGTSQTYSPTIGGTIVFIPYINSSGNVVSYCDIGPSVSGPPSTSIYIQGNHSQDTIKNCNIYDFFAYTRPSAGIFIGSGTTNIAVKDNRFYQTVTRNTFNPATPHSVIRVENPSGNNYLISGNTIGYSSSSGTGNYTLIGYNNFSFTPIYLNVGSSGVTNVQGNTITNISYTQQQASVIFSAIDAASGLVNIGNLVPNVIGNMSSTGNITLTGSTGSMDNYGIRCSGSSNNIISNNLIGGINLSKVSDFTQFKFTCIGNSSSGTFTCQNNVIGGNIVNSIRSSYNVEGNLELTGISSSNGTSTITGNSVKNLNVNCGGQAGGSVMTANGISLTANTPGNFISQNRIQSLGITGSTGNANTINGIYVNTSSGTCTVEKNLIHSLILVSTNIITNGIFSSFRYINI